MSGAKVVDKRLICKVGSVHFFAQNSPKEATNVGRNGPKFSWGQKLEAFTVY